MTTLRRWSAVVREAVATGWAQPVASIVTIVVIAGMCTAVLLTSGRTVGAEQAILGSIDAEGTRSIIIRAEPTAGLDPTVLDRIKQIQGIQWAGAFGPALDVTNAAFPGATRVPVRLAWGDDFQRLGLPNTSSVPGSSVWASSNALDSLGMPDQVGGATTGDGRNFAVVGTLTTPDYLTFLEPLAIAPQTDRVGQVSVLVVVAARPDLVAPVSDAVLSVLAVDDPTLITFSTSENLAELRALVQGQLGSFGRNLVILIFSLTAVLVAAILYGLVMLRRRDFGRRRALGASRSLIIGLLLTQTGILALTGAAIGSATATIALITTGDPLPGPYYFAAVSILAAAVGVTAAVLPAIAAAQRDPLKELRVP